MLLGKSDRSACRDHSARFAPCHPSHRAVDQEEHDFPIPTLPTALVPGKNGDLLAGDKMLLAAILLRIARGHSSGLISSISFPKAPQYRARSDVVDTSPEKRSGKNLVLPSPY